MSQPITPVAAPASGKSADLLAHPGLQVGSAAPEPDQRHRGSIRVHNASAAGAPSLRESAERQVSPAFVPALAALLGIISFGVLLTSRHIADGDLWAKLALGAHVWKMGTLPHHNVFAFTPVLPEYVDHEWGAGTIFFGLLKFFGPASLMWLKIVLAFGALGAALLTGRRSGCGWAPLLILAIPAAGCVVLGYVPVIRSHTFTYCLFALTLVCLEEIARPRPFAYGEEKGTGKPSVIPLAIMIVGIMLIWVNVHGGFVAGLGTIGIYAGLPLLQLLLQWIAPAVQLPASAKGNGLLSPTPLLQWRRGRTGARFPTSWPDFMRKREVRLFRTISVLLVVAFGSLAVTCINPYGVKFWFYVLPAILAKRPLIAEWQPLPVLAWDVFIPFRILFLLVLSLLVTGWKGTQRKSWTGLVMMGVTSFLAWRSRRHAPFFGIAALAFAGPYLVATLDRLKDFAQKRTNETKIQSQSINQSSSLFTSLASVPLRPVLKHSSLCLIFLYTAVTAYAALEWLPDASFQILAPVGHDPVREADILSLAHAKGNLATPFHWGSYSSWRLYPNIKVSMDGRYEAAYPESTFQLNARFFDKSGPDWDRLIRDYLVDYVLLDLTQGGLRPEDLQNRGYVLIWVSKGSSALLALQKHANGLGQLAAALPPTTIEPLDAAITDRWWAP
jgi:hypothetical protein